VCALIPAYRNAATVGDVVRRARPHVDEVVVVDDGSGDATGDEARRAGAHVVAHAFNRGKGAALATGLELGAKFQLTDPADKGLVLSLAPSVAGGAVPIPDNPIGVVYVTLPLLLGVGVGHGHQLVVAAKVANWMLLGDIGLDSLVLDELVVGGSVGFVLKLHEKFRLMPEVSVMRPVWVSEDLGGTGTMGSAAFGNAFLVQFSVAALFFGGGGPAYATSPSAAPASAPASAPAD